MARRSHCAGKSEAEPVNLSGPNAYIQRLFEEQQKCQAQCLAHTGASEIIRKEVGWGDHRRGKDIQEVTG